MKAVRLGLISAMVGAFIVPAAAPASATCRPEKPSTCEAELPPRPELSCTVDVHLPNGDSFTLNYCELAPE